MKSSFSPVETCPRYDGRAALAAPLDNYPELHCNFDLPLPERLAQTNWKNKHQIRILTRCLLVLKSVPPRTCLSPVLSPV
jgi:hypothetical protein